MKKKSANKPVDWWANELKAQARHYDLPDRVNWQRYRDLECSPKQALYWAEKEHTERRKQNADGEIGS